ncbi:PEP-CTERM sorting domain-containing protein [Chitinimonas arctica]|uniref:PEP-CTERM sorting domain-containing protein n=1 Tax=Chitinimonas arctica TaxID=2594795 RepID=A0A516SHW0_9NEIS|nr:PEP-CTERM sorting domain-containing protein [Chitinimonas arctica]QDQ27749.1 PEP-CTERM sorting domain-containing protein [Chitinimonas arctica]
MKKIAIGLCLSFSLAHASPITLATGNVQITFDDASSYESEVMNGFGNIIQTDLPVFAGVGNGLRLTPALYNSIGGSGFWEEGLLRISFRDISFSAQAGYAITGYRLSFSGQADKYSAGSFNHQGGGIGSVSFSGSNYTYSSLIGVDALENSSYAILSLSAPYVANDDGTASVFGLASGSIENFTIEAVTQPVPEPESYAMLLTGLAGIGLLARRRGRAEAAG